MVTVQYFYNSKVEACRLSIEDATEYVKALESKGITCQIVSTN